MTGQFEVVRTVGWYLKKYVSEARERGGIPIVCSLVPRRIMSLIPTTCASATEKAPSAAPTRKRKASSRRRPAKRAGGEAPASPGE